jgi:peptidoglycan/LPS O-acetylase OafA/YrhL
MADATQIQTTQPPTTPRLESGIRTLNSLTSLRFFAALLVFGTHAGLTGAFTDRSISRQLSSFFDPGGRYGVSFFFVLSGFVLTWSARPGRPVRAFYRARAAKILPLHVATWAIVLVLLAWAGRPSPVKAAAWNLFLLHAWVLHPPTVMVSVNAPSYTLCSEALFYLTFPLWILLVRRIRPSLLWATLLLTAAGGLLMGVVATYLVSPHPVLPFYGVSLAQSWYAKIFPPVHLFEFLAGMVTAQLLLSGRRVRLGVLPALAVAAVGYFIEAKVSLLYSFGAVTILPAAILIAAVAEADMRGARSYGLRRRPLVWLGEISFALYMVHWIVLTFGHQWLGPKKTWSTPVATGLLLLALVVSILAAWLMHIAVERPVMRHWSRSRKPAPEHPPVPVTTPMPRSAVAPE